MSQIPRCSQHHIPLVIERRSLSFLGFTDMITTGRCAKCDVIYISQRIMGCERISIDRQKYVYCEDLSDNSLNIAQAEKEKIVFEQRKNADLSDLKKENDGLRELLSQTNEQLEEAQKKIARMSATFSEQYERDLHRVREMYAEEKRKIVRDYHAQIIHLQEAKDRAEKGKKQSEALLLQQNREAQLLDRSYISSLEDKICLLTKENQNLRQRINEIEVREGKVLFIKEKLYVCGGQIKCEKYKHPIESVTAVVDTITGKVVTMTVQHCKYCSLYFIRDAVFESYRSRYGAILGRFIKKKDGMTLGGLSTSGELSPESLLHMNGYRVNQKENLSADSRRKILTYVIESKIMERTEIINLLSCLIRMNSTNSTKEEAVSRWLSDLNWVNDYHADKQATVWLAETAMYQYWKQKK